MTRLHQPQLTFSPTMLSMTRSSGPPLFFFSLTCFLLLGAATTVSSAERCFLQQEHCIAVCSVFSVAGEYWKLRN